MFALPLTRGQAATIDDEFSELAARTWYARWDKTTRGYYAGCRPRKGAPSLLHRVVMELKLGRPLLRTETVDHRNHDTLDCRIENLRIATMCESAANKRRYKNNTSGFKGVCPHRTAWTAQISARGEQKYLGSFPTAEAAAVAYDRAARKLHGEFAVLNFPGRTEAADVDMTQIPIGQRPVVLDHFDALTRSG